VGFGEFVTFVPNSPEAATAYADTLGDIALGMVGGLVGAIATSRLPILEANPGAGLTSAEQRISPARRRG